MASGCEESATVQEPVLGDAAAHVLGSIQPIGLAASPPTGCQVSGVRDDRGVAASPDPQILE
jgi:hypothetical protein